MDTANTSNQEVQLLSTVGIPRCSVIIVASLGLYNTERWQSLSHHDLSHVYFSDKGYGL